MISLPEFVRFLLKTPSIVLTNLILGENAVPEFKQEDCTGPVLATALEPLLSDTDVRRRQVAALALVPGKMDIGRTRPSEAVAPAARKICCLK